MCNQNILCLLLHLLWVTLQLCWWVTLLWVTHQQSCSQCNGILNSFWTFARWLMLFQYLPSLPEGKSCCILMFTTGGKAGWWLGFCWGSLRASASGTCGCWCVEEQQSLWSRQLAGEAQQQQHGGQCEGELTGRRVNGCTQREHALVNTTQYSYYYVPLLGRINRTHPRNSRTGL